MIVDARSLPQNQVVETDICIVGSGTAGMTLAREFIGQEFRVCLLESGGLKPDQATQALYRGENIGHPYFTLDSARARYFGGSTNRWHIAIGDNCVGARMRPLDEIDFEKRDWVPYSGWPFSKSHLDPYYHRAQVICKIEPPTYATEGWEDPQETPRLPFVGDSVKTVIFKFGSRYPFISNYSKEITQASNITTYLYANVVEIETNETAQTVTRLRVACLQGNKSWVSAKLFILATGAIEIPRLLLLSNKTQCAGLGNQNDLVGRFFMEHLHFWSGLFVPSSPEIFNLTALYDNIHIVNGVPVIGKLSLTEKVIRREKLLNYVAELSSRVVLHSSLYQFLYPRISSKSVRSFKILRSAIRNADLPENLGKHVKNVIIGIEDIAVTAYRNIKRKILKPFNKKRIQLFRLANMSEQVPNPNSRVTLADDRDSLGQNRVKLDWRLSTIDIQSAVRSQEIMNQEIKRAGLGQLFIELGDETPPHKITGGWHHMGTTRMHVDPKKGVVDRNCRVHGISNLFVAGPSLFPTGGYANPSLTIVALAIRLSDHIKELLRKHADV
jgi:choline dehydrogenase-like flavoprotein